MFPVPEYYIKSCNIQYQMVGGQLNLPDIRTLLVTCIFMCYATLWMYLTINLSLRVLFCFLAIFSVAFSSVFCSMLYL